MLIFEESTQLSYQVARRIANLIEEHTAVGKNLVLGLPTGSTPIGVYGHLVRMHREQGLDFSRVVTFNLDEYYPMAPEDLQSYHRFMRENFFRPREYPRKEHSHSAGLTFPGTTWRPTASPMSSRFRRRVALT